MKTPLFTVVTITYNSGEWIEECIKSILKSTFKDFELLISDDCSTDNTWESIQQFSDDRIIAWQNESNVGEYKNRNKALAAAKGKYFLFVDGDDILYEESLGNLVSYINEFPTLVSIFGIDKKCLPQIQVPLLLTGKEAYKWIYSYNVPIAFVGFAETLFKTETLKLCGGFPENFVCGDTYIKKLMPAFGPILIITDSLQNWRTSENQASSNLNKDLIGYQNNVIIDRKILTNPIVKRWLDNPSVYNHNIKVRDAKLLFRHTILTLNLSLGFKLFKKLEFKLSDFKYLFTKSKIEKFF